MKIKQSASNFYLISALLLFSFLHCDNLSTNASKFFPYLGTGESPVVLASSPITNTSGVSPTASVQIIFDRTMKIYTCQEAFSITPNIPGYFILSPFSLEFTPSENLSNGSYTVKITKNCEDEKGHDLKNVFSLVFGVGSMPGGGTTSPSISSIQVQQGTLAACNAGTGTNLDIIANDVTNACLGTASSRNPVVITFSEAMDTAKTTLAVSASFSGDFDWSGGGTILTITPDVPFVYGTRYNVNISTSAESTLGYSMSTAVTSSFVAGAITGPPTVQAIGVESQGCASSFPGVGSATGGDWTLGSCYWDSSLAVLSASSYYFRGGDDGSGASASTAACSDVATDNFKIIFSNYMNPTTTASAVRLQRLSPPLTTVRMATYSWSDCQGVYPYGCRVLITSFSELEASCNGSLAFGNAATGGDFNLLRTDNAPADFPFYQLFVDTTAIDVNGVNLRNQFQFVMEGK
ncbi:Ig-like domain-containing protein [Leptospira sp. id769339]|uniref:Ig-like domain-containing protein n=1 Tax=Leptospira sp. id769339 TaxID=2864221 RepID=UPI00214B996B|nr:Ig-like domain-containing protein [Leptospira sp. id769339]MCR1795523.1 Ig-like domain-containing protein [Leptospira sp. id769339]